MTTKISNFLAPNDVLLDIRAPDKISLLHDLATRASPSAGLPTDVILTELLKREQLGSTGMGGGVAIPHAKIHGLERMSGVVVQLNPPLAFDSVDDAPVDIVFALLSPVDSGAEHLKTLARVSRYLRDEGHVARLRGAKSAEALHALLAGGEARDAA